MIKFPFVLDSAHFVRVCIDIVFDILNNSILGPGTFPQPSIMLAQIVIRYDDEAASIKPTYTKLSNTHPLERSEDRDQWVHPNQ